MEGSVYLKARQKWDERYADLVLGKRTWHITAAAMMAVTLVLAFGMVWAAPKQVRSIRGRGRTSSPKRSGRRVRSPRTPRGSALTGWCSRSGRRSSATLVG
jgi:hypothetical protein